MSIENDKTADLMRAAQTKVDVLPTDVGAHLSTSAYIEGQKLRYDNHPLKISLRF